MISAAMIVKDEERFLPDCIRSFANYVNEIVIVDTGSTDRTVEIAEAFGAKVYHHPWEGDFSLHRNQSIEYCTKNDWIFIIDADEELVRPQFSPDQFWAAFEALPENVGTVLVMVHEKPDGAETVNHSWPGLRFFKKSKGFHYDGTVHNKPKVKGIAVGSDIQLIHKGYSLDPAKMYEKRVRTKKLLLDRIKKSPDDYNALYYLCQTALSMEDFQEGIDYGLEFIRHFPYSDPETLQFYGTIYYSMAGGYLELKDLENAWAWANKGLEFWPDDLDLNWQMAEIGFCSKRQDIFWPAAMKYTIEYNRLKGLFNEGTLKYTKADAMQTIHSHRHRHAFNPKAMAFIAEWMKVMGGETYVP